MLEDALAAVALERDAVAAAFADHRRLVNTFRRWTPSLRRKLTEKQQRGVQGVQRRQAYRLAAAVLVVWSRRTKAKRRADRVLARITGAVDRKRARRQLRCWRDGARRAMRAERAVTYSMLVVVRRCPPSTRHRTPVPSALPSLCRWGARAGPSTPGGARRGGGRTRRSRATALTTLTLLTRSRAIARRCSEGWVSSPTPRTPTTPTAQVSHYCASLLRFLRASSCVHLWRGYVARCHDTRAAAQKDRVLSDTDWVGVSATVTPSFV